MSVRRLFIGILIIVALVGAFLRVFALDRKSYWFDETFTSLRISGSTDQEIVRKFSNSSELAKPSELRKYQSPQVDKSAIDTVTGLAVEEPQNPPLYYVAARLWAGWFGGSVYETRLLPALISLLVLPLVYWLCLELFDEPIIGLFAVALFAASPFHLLMAQTARPQSLWTVTVVFTSAALLRAIRTKRITSWSIYALGLIASLYTFVLSVLFMIGFLIYVLSLEGFRRTRTSTAIVASSALASLAFLPWCFVLYSSRTNVIATTYWVDSKLSPIAVSYTHLTLPTNREV